MEKIQIIGHIGNDAKEHIIDGRKNLRFTVAVNQGKTAEGKEREPNWYTIFKPISDESRLKDYLLKGTSIFVEGRLSIDFFQNKLTRNINCNVLEFISKAKVDTKKEEVKVESEESQEVEELI